MNILILVPSLLYAVSMAAQKLLDRGVSFPSTRRTTTTQISPQGKLTLASKSLVGFKRGYKGWKRRK